jgi:hypothetical protein
MCRQAVRYAASLSCTAAHSSMPCPGKHATRSQACFPISNTARQQACSCPCNCLRRREPPEQAAASLGS